MAVFPPVTEELQNFHPRHKWRGIQPTFFVNSRFKIRRVIIVCDRGMVSEKNIGQLELDGYEYVVGMRMRQLKKEDAGELLSTQGMRPVTKGLKARVVFWTRGYWACDRHLIFSSGSMAIP